MRSLQTSRPALVGALLLCLFVVTSCSDDDGCINCVPDPPDPARINSDTFDLELTSPDRAAMLEEGGLDNYALAVAGAVCDPELGITMVRVNDVAAAFDPAQPCSDFELQMPSRWGLNLLEAFARNADGNRVLRAQSYMRSPTWRGADAQYHLGRIAKGGFVHVRQDLLDDGDRAGVPNDLATIAELAIAEQDLAAQVPVLLKNDVSNHAYDCGVWPVTWTEHNKSGAKVTRTGPMTYSEVTVDEITIRANDIYVRLNVHDVGLPLKVQYHEDLGCLGEVEHDFYGRASMDRLQVTTELATTSIPGGPIEFVAQNTASSTHGYSYSLDGFDLGGVIQDYVGGEIRKGINGSVGPLVEEQINTQVLPLLRMFEVPQRIELPAPISLTLLAQATWDGVLLVPQEETSAGYLQLHSAIHVLPETVAPAHADARGSIEYGGSPPVIDQDVPAFALALKEDFLNQVFWAVWMGGGLDFDDLGGFTGTTGLTGLGVKTLAHLPPVIMPGAEPGDVKLGIGDYHGELMVTQQVMDAAMAAAPDLAARAACLADGIVVGAWISMVQDGRLEIDTETGKFDFTPKRAPEVIVEVTGLEDPFCAAMLGNYLKETIGNALPGVLALIIDSFPAPRYEINQVPGGLVWELADFKIDRLGNYQCIEGTFGDIPLAGGR